MNNPRITPKELNLIKGALNRVFSRSELRQKIINNAVVPGYLDAKRPRVKTWCKCNVCNKLEARSYVAVDHIKPKIGLHESFSMLSLDEYINRLWCEEENLQPICEECHNKKSALEAKERARIKRELKNVHKKYKRSKKTIKKRSKRVIS